MIYYDITQSQFGNTLIASTEDGVCAVFFGNNPEQELDKLISNTDLHKVHRQNHAQNIIDQIKSNEELKNIQLDIISGTPFQRWVWGCLRKVQQGTTITYSELAMIVGLPRAVRAVATAVANNPISIIIPCHRIVPKSGGIGNYRWGSEMKRQLIEREKIKK